ncbi:MAG: imidazole glycerol phosphate synthase subunit HisH [Pseudomonadota bacterium]
MKPPDVVVVSTGTANLASVLAGLRRAGAAPRIAVDPAEVVEACGVVLPGVGALAAAMARLHEDGFVEVIRERLLQGRPTLAICLGMQLLAEGSDESPGVGALGVVAGHVSRFPDTVRVPQMGWNQVAPQPGCRLLRPGWAYFANSFRLEETPRGWDAGLTEYGGPFVAALERGPILACQFHPELSGPWGTDLLTRWVDETRNGGA